MEKIFRNRFNVSNGSLHITSIDTDRKTITGSFRATPAGHIVASQGQVETVLLEGAFKLKYE
ncbi:MAG: hypothetical protein QM594_03085 [Niabella sp.]